MTKQLEYPTSLPYADKGRIPSMIPQLVRRPLLVKDEEQNLAVRARNGDQKARCRVVEANMRLVCSIAKRYEAQQIPFEDLVQEGAIGLLQAVDRFDADKGCRFSTYAVYWIKHAIRKAVVNRSRVIRLPAHAFEERKRLLRFREDFEASNSRPPTTDELADAYGYAKEKVATLLGVEHDCLSLDNLSGTSDYAAHLPDLSCDNPEGVALEKVSHEALMKCLSRLSERERSVIVRRLGLDPNSVPQDARSIARDLGISRAGVQQIEANAIRSLRKLVVGADCPRKGTNMKPHGRFRR